MHGTQDDGESALRAIDEELEQLARRTRENVGPALILKQAQLLERRSRILQARGEVDRALTDATSAIALGEGLRNIANMDIQRAAAIVIAGGTTTLGSIALLAEDIASAREHQARASAALLVGRGDDDSKVEALTRLGQLQTGLTRAEAIAQEGIAAEVRSHDHADLQEVAHEIARLIVRASEIVADLREHGIDLRIEDQLSALVAKEVVRQRLLETEVESEGSPSVIEAREKGRQLQLDAWQSESMVSASQLQATGADGKAILLTDDMLRGHRDSGLLLGLPHPDRPSELGYPQWQFNLPREKRDALTHVLRALGDAHPWAKWNFLNSALERLLGLTPIEVLGFLRKDSPKSKEATLRHRDRVRAIGNPLEAVLRAAKSYVEGRD
jgi:hypothetical protein